MLAISAQRRTARASLVWQEEAARNGANVLQMSRLVAKSRLMTEVFIGPMPQRMGSFGVQFGSLPGFCQR